MYPSPYCSIMVCCSMPTCVNRRGKYYYHIKVYCTGLWIYIVPDTEHLSFKVLRYTSHSFIYKLHHTCLYLKSIHQTAPSVTCNGIQLIAAYYSFTDPKRMKGWVGLVGWPIADGLPMDISGHPSAAGWVQDRESSPVRDRRSTTVPCNHLITVSL